MAMPAGIPATIAPVSALADSEQVPPVPSPATPSGQPLVRPSQGQVFRLYSAVFGRKPDAGGFAYWVEELQAGAALEQVAAGFVGSQEFVANYGTLDDDGLVEALYANVLGRAPDEPGRRFWLSQLQNELGRVSLVVFFSESSEFVALTGTALPPLPPFQSSVSGVTEADLGSSWRRGCPVGPEDLRRLELGLVSFSGSAHSGTLVVNADVVEEVVAVFAALYAARYPVELMQPVDSFNSDDFASMEANNTSAFNCRPVTGGTTWSRHAYGRAIDLNPRQNPYVSSDLVAPSEGELFIDRRREHPAIIRSGGAAQRAFEEVGWRWGGDFSAIKDWQHFDRR